MGVQYKGVCYPTAELAKANACASSYQSTIATTNVYTSECTTTNFGTSGPAAMVICKRTNGGACTNINQPYPVFNPCTYDAPSSMSSEYFAAVLAFLVVVYVGKHIYKLFWRREYDH